MIKIFLVLLISIALFLPASILAQPTPTPTPTPSPTTFPVPLDRFSLIYLDSTCLLYGQPEGCVDDSGFYYYDKVTGKYHKQIPFENGIPLCSDPIYETGVFESCYDKGDPDDPVTPKPGLLPQPPCPVGVEESWCADNDAQDYLDECHIHDCSDVGPEVIGEDNTPAPEVIGEDSDVGPEVIGEDNTPAPEDIEEEGSDSDFSEPTEDEESNDNGNDEVGFQVNEEPDSSGFDEEEE